MILYDEGMPRQTTDKTRRVGVPDKGLKQMVTSNFDICRRHARASASEKNIFPRRFQKIVLYLVRPVWNIATGGAKGLRIGACAGRRDAVEVGEKRVDHGDIRHVVQG